VFKSLIETLEGKRPLGRAKHSWWDNITIVLTEIGCKGINWF
jgi:hypothetical protein